MRGLIEFTFCCIGLLVIAAVLEGAPLPRARPKPPPPPAVTAEEMTGSWVVEHWYVHLLPNGDYWATSDPAKAANGQFCYFGEWSFKDGTLTVSEWHIAQGQGWVKTYTAKVTRPKGGKIGEGLTADGNWMTGAWRRR